MFFEQIKHILFGISFTRLFDGVTQNYEIIKKNILSWAYHIIISY